MRKVFVLTLVGSFLIAGVLIRSMGSQYVLAQAQPTPTLSLSDILGGPPEEPIEPEVVETPETTTLDANTPTLYWVQIATSDFDILTFEDVTVGGPVDAYTTNIGDPCPQNVFSAQLPVFELHIQSDVDTIRVGFVADDGTPTAIFMWDNIEGHWWCSTEVSAESEISFEPLAAGDYPIYVAVLGTKDKITGTLYVGP